MDHTEKSRISSNDNKFWFNRNRSKTLRKFNATNRNKSNQRFDRSTSRKRVTIARTITWKWIRDQSERISLWKNSRRSSTNEKKKNVWFLFRLQKENSSSTTIALPPVDAYSQQTIRLSIVNEKLHTWFDERERKKPQIWSTRFSFSFKQIFADRFETQIIRNLRSALSDLLSTFHYQSDNITLKPNEWTIMTLFLSFL